MSGRRDTGKGLALDDDDDKWEKVESEDEDEELASSTFPFFRPFDFDIKHYFFSLPPAPAGTSSMETSTDKEGKRINDKEEEEEEEEEEKAKQVSKEGKASSSSTPLEETASEIEASGIGNVDLPFSKLAIQNVDDDDVMSQSISGEGTLLSEMVIQEELQYRAAMNQSREYPISRLGEFQKLVQFLFQMELTRTDVRRGRLSISFQTAESHFPKKDGISKSEWQILISDTSNDNWYMTLTYNPGVSTAFKFVITSGWQEFVDWHSLKSMDVIRFYRPIPRLMTDHFVIDYVKAVGNVVLPSRKSRRKQGRDDLARHEVISKSKSGRGSCPSERSNQDPFRKSVFLFETQTSPIDVQQGMLLLPVDLAANHFPPIPPHLLPIYEHKIEITDAQNQNWNMIAVYNSLYNAFMIIRGWHKFALSHNLELEDVLCFYRPFVRLHNWHFLIEHVKKVEAEKENPPPVFKQENFLFELELSSAAPYVLFIPKKAVRKYFPVIPFPGGRTLCFTDALNKDWSMEIHLAKDRDAYMLTDGWEGFVNKHKLDAKDGIRFYRPVQPLHEGHFLVACVRRVQVEAGTTRHTDESGGDGAEKDGSGGDGENRDDGNRGGPAGTSHGGGGGGGSSGKRTAGCCWAGKNQHGGRKRAVMALEEFLRETNGSWEENGINSQLVKTLLLKSVISSENGFS